MNIWAVNHDEELWEKPYELCPNRYLTEDGQVVQASHPCRRHNLAFGGGTRVCIGETFALSRMFAVLSAFMVNFDLHPGTSLEEQPSCKSQDVALGQMDADMKVRFVTKSG